MKESKLTKYTLIGCTLLLIAYFSTSARADEVGTEYELKANISATIVLCYAVEKSLENNINADWWMSFGISWFNNEAMLAAGISDAFDGMRHDATREEWDLAANACNELKKEFMKYAEEQKL